MNAKFRRTPNQTRELRARTLLNLPVISLLWPSGMPGKMISNTQWEQDMGLNDLVSALSLSGRYTAYVRQVLSTLTADVEVIAWRQAVLADFMRNPSLIEQSQTLLPRLAALQQGNALLGKRQRNLLLDTADHLAELDSYLEVTQTLQQALTQSVLESAALIRLRDNLTTLIADRNFQTLRQEMPGLRAPLEKISSLTIGINLDVELRPLSAVLLSINDYSLSEKVSWLERVIGARVDNADESGIAPLHQLPEKMDERILYPLFQDLDRLLTQIAKPIAKALARYARANSDGLKHLEYELAFFVAAARLVQQLEASRIIICQPEIAPMSERTIEIEALVNIALTLRNSDKPIANAVEFGSSGCIAILTGPNSGGKTTYLRAVGLAQVMFQAGLFIPAQRARISPVDKILTHFPALETRQEGRLAEEASRLRDILQQATAHSLVLMNETFSSTASGEAVYLAQDILSALRVIGTRAIYATHLIELAERLREIEAAVEGNCLLFSLVAGIQVMENGESRPTYEIKRGQPLGQSYAREIARRHGISLEQILAERREQTTPPKAAHHQSPQTHL